MRRFCILALFAMVFFAACGLSEAQTSALRQEQVVDGITIGLEAADNALLNTNQEFIVTLTDADGTPIEDASVYLDLTMPAMPMAGTVRRWWSE
ncbi:MAG: hypothetical protein HC882_09065 [Acidobacteria bacterium]|nr:hypothetical protein [Acidobacteriota bacterium]